MQVHYLIRIHHHGLCMRFFLDIEHNTHIISNSFTELNAEDRLEHQARRTWLESVKADMAELEIGKEDVHDRKKCRWNVMKRKSNPIGKLTINR